MLFLYFVIFLYYTCAAIVLFFNSIFGSFLTKMVSFEPFFCRNKQSGHFTELLLSDIGTNDTTKICHGDQSCHYRVWSSFVQGVSKVHGQL